MISKKSQAITRVIAFLLAFTVVVVVFISIMGPDGKVHVTDDKVTEMQDKLIEVNREWRGITREQINADAGLVELWESVVDDVLMVKGQVQTDDEYVDQYCIVPFRRTLFQERRDISTSERSTDSFAVSSFDSKNNIQFLESDGDILVMLSYLSDETDHVPQIKLVTIPDMELYYGVPSEVSSSDDDVFPSIQKYPAESISTRVITRIDNEDFPFADNIGADIVLVDSSQLDGPRLYQPIHSQDGDFMSSISANNVIQPHLSLSDRYYPLSYDSVILANANELIVIVNTFENVDNPSSFNILDSFGANSGFGTGQDGFPFCNPEYNAQLAPHTSNIEDCQCEHAENQAMCNSLTEDNCASNCFWDGNQNMCRIDDNEIRPFFNALASKFAEIGVNAGEGKNCWDYYTLDADDVPETNLNEILEDAYLSHPGQGGPTVNNNALNIRSPKHNIVSNPFPTEIMASDFTFGTNNHPIYFSGSNDDNDLVIEPNENDDERNRIIELNDGAYYFYVRFSSNDVNLLTRQDVQNLFRDKDYNMEFCNPDIPYELGLYTRGNVLNDATICSHIDNKGTCLYHGLKPHSEHRNEAFLELYEDAPRCFWTIFRTSTGCVSIENVVSQGGGNHYYLDAPDEVFTRIDQLREKIESGECFSREDLLSDDLSVNSDERVYRFLIDNANSPILYLRHIKQKTFGGPNYRDYPIVHDERITLCPEWWVEDE